MTVAGGLKTSTFCIEGYYLLDYGAPVEAFYCKPSDYKLRIGLYYL